MKETSIILREKDFSLSGEVVYLTFDFQEEFSFQEGQFLMMEEQLNGEKIKRAYSIASTNRELQEKKQAGFYIKKASEKGMSNYLTKEIKEGDEIKIQGPFGKMVNDHKTPHYLFISVGCGLGPLLSIYQELLETGNYEKISFLFGEKYRNDIVPQIENLLTSISNSNIKNLLYLSRDENTPEFLRKGYVQDGITESIDFLGTTQIKTFLCGKPEMVDSLKKQLTEKGINQELIHTEKF